MPDRSEYPDIRIAERSWWLEVEGGKSEEEEGGGVFVLRAEKVEDGEVFLVLQADT